MASILNVDQIRNAAGTSAMTIDSSGRMTAPNQTRFYGTKASDQTITRGNTTKITGFTNNEIDTSSAFDGTTFTAPVAGDYYLFGQVFANFTPAGNDGETAVFFLYINGAEKVRDIFRNDSTRDLDDITLGSSIMATLAVGDTVEVYAYLVDNNGGNAEILGHVGSNFGGYLLG